MYNLSKLVGQVSHLCERVDTPRSLTVAIMLRYNDFEAIAKLGINPDHYLDSSDYMRDNFVTCILRKLDVGSDLSATSFQKWLDCESQCRSTNLKFVGVAGYGSCLVRARAYIKKILGRLPENLLDKARHGPGAGVGFRGFDSGLHRKMAGDPTITRDAIHTVRFFKEHAWVRAVRATNRAFQVVPGNELLFVPKDAKIMRPIAVEPTFNMYAQLAIGAALRSKLRRVGIDLDNGQQVHKALAQKASRDGSYATLDLSSASDTVSLELVRYLLPPDWFALLETFRSPCTSYDGRVYTLEKFSSMGNGYTFELETLLFFAICQTQSDRPCYTYGDDMIVPTESAEFCTTVLQHCGLTLNRDKSFTAGVFRESCGGDYFDGLSVRGTYIKKVPRTLADLIVLINQLYKVREQSEYFYFRYLRLWRADLIKTLKDHVRYGPEFLGDAVVHDEDWKERVVFIHKASQPWVHFIEGYGIKARPFKIRTNPEVMLALILSGQITSNGIVTRASEMHHRLRLYSCS